MQGFELNPGTVPLNSGFRVGSFVTAAACSTAESAETLDAELASQLSRADVVPPGEEEKEEIKETREAASGEESDETVVVLTHSPVESSPTQSARKGTSKVCHQNLRYQFDSTLGPCRHGERKCRFAHCYSALRFLQCNKGSRCPFVYFLHSASMYVNRKPAREHLYSHPGETSRDVFIRNNMLPADIKDKLLARHTATKGRICPVIKM